MRGLFGETSCNSCAYATRAASDKCDLVLKSFWREEPSSALDLIPKN
jgi:hypothetical protein